MTERTDRPLSDDLEAHVFGDSVHLIPSYEDRGGIGVDGAKNIRKLGEYLIALSDEIERQWGR